MDLEVLIGRFTRTLCGNWLLKVGENLVIISQIYKSGLVGETGGKKTTGET